MAERGLILVTGAGGGVGGVGGKVVALLRQRGRAVRAMAHHDDDRADALRALALTLRVTERDAGDRTSRGRGSPTRGGAVDSASDRVSLRLNLAATWRAPDAAGEEVCHRLWRS